MPLGYSENEKIKAHLEGKNNSCPLCGNNNWGIFDEVVSPVCFDIEYKRIIEGKLLPVVLLICNEFCNECGNVRQISAMKVGLL